MKYETFSAYDPRHTALAESAFLTLWSSRGFAKVLGYADYRNFQSVIESARTDCFNIGQRVEDHFVDVTDMVEIGRGAQRPLKTVMMFRDATLLPRLNDEVDALAAKVDSHLKKMGAAL